MWKASRSSDGERNQNLGENDPNPEEFVKYHDRIVYTVEVGKSYKVSIEQFRKILRYNRSDSLDDLILFILHLEEVEHPVYVFVRPIDLYYLGFGFNTGETFEFGSFNDNSGLLGLTSLPLGYKEGYGDMGGLGKVKIGYGPFVHAVREIAKGQYTVKVNEWKKKIQGCLGTVAVTLCEGARFHPVFYKIDRLMMSFGNMCVEPWMQGYINGWEDISDVALNGKMSGKDDRKPPTSEDHDYVDDDTRMAFKHKDWAMHVIAVNHQPDALPNVPTVSYQNFHLVIVGDRGTGKTSFVKTCLSREFLNNEEATKGVEYHLLDFSTTRGRLRINCWDVEENEKFRALRDRCYKQCDFALIMFDVTKWSTYDNVRKWHDDLRRINRNIQIAICGNKADFRKKREIKSHQVTFPRLNNPQYYETSAKSSLNLEEPFLYLARKFMGDPNLEFGEVPDELENG